jgi:CTP synthase
MTMRLVLKCHKKILSQKGLIFSGINSQHGLVEIVELKGHPWFVAVQFHPEFKSKPDRAHPLFKGFVAAALEHKETVKK